MQFLLLIYDNEKRWTSESNPDYGSELVNTEPLAGSSRSRFSVATLSSQPRLPGPSVFETVHL
jgi:hypothetical protein